VRNRKYSFGPIPVDLWYAKTVSGSCPVVPALAVAGYHAVAPDMRGYGQTDAPPNIQDYTQFQFVGDMVRLVYIFGYEQAVIAGHDLGAMVAQNAAILRPDIFRAVILLSVPYGARTEGAVKPQKQCASAHQRDNSSTKHISRCPEWPRGVRRRSEAHTAHVPVLASDEMWFA